MYLKLFIVFIIVQSCLPEKDSPKVIDRSRPAKLGDVPYQVAFKERLKGHEYTTFCGGVIIAPSNILTAAHCFEWDSINDEDDFEDRHVKDTKLLSIYAVAGNILNRAKSPVSWSWPLNSPDNKLKKFNMSVYMQTIRTQGGGQWRSLLEGVYPNNYKFPRADIAVIKVQTPFQFNKHVRSIPIATRHKDYTAMTCLVSGYGDTYAEQHVPEANRLLLADLKILPTYFCNLKHQKNMKNFVCSTKVSDISKGDSGGPLVCKGTGDPNDMGSGVLVGIVSGHSDGVGSFFTRVSSYSDFIKKNNATRNTKSLVLVCALAIYVSICLF